MGNTLNSEFTIVVEQTGPIFSAIGAQRTGALTAELSLTIEEVQIEDIIEVLTADGL